MNQRTKSIWVPGLITLIFTSGALAIVQVWRVQPHVVWVGGLALTLYVPWLFAQPVFGAIGAYLSRRAGGTRSARLASNLSPSLTMLAAFCVVLGVAIALDVPRIGGGFRLEVWPALVANLALWVLIPASGLALGVLPFLGAAKPQES